MNVIKLSDEELRTLIHNHEQKHAFDKPAYAEALAELNRRNSNLLHFEKTFALVRKAAAQEKFISYADVARANNAAWNAVRYPMNAHLWLLVKKAHSHGWPMLSAIIVNKQNVASGEMENATLAGFIEAATALGYEPTNAKSFLREQQKACFEWAKEFDDA